MTGIGGNITFWLWEERAGTSVIGIKKNKTNFPKPVGWQETGYFFRGWGYSVYQVSGISAVSLGDVMSTL